MGVWIWMGPERMGVDIVCIVKVAMLLGEVLRRRLALCFHIF